MAEKRKRGRPPNMPPPPPPPLVAPDPADRPLSDEEQRFLDLYCVANDAAASWREMHPDCDFRHAGRNGKRVLKRPHVRAELFARRMAARIRCQVRADSVLREYGRIAFSDLIDLYGPDGRLLPVRQIPLDTRRAIKSIKLRREHVRTQETRVREGKKVVTVNVTIHEQEIDIQLHDKISGLERLARYLGIDGELPPLDMFLSSLPPAVAADLRRQLEMGTPPKPEGE